MKFPMRLPFTDFTLGDEKFTDFMASIGVESGNLTDEFGELRLNLYGNGLEAVYRRVMKVKSPGIVVHWSQEQQIPTSADVPEIEYVWVLQGVVGVVNSSGAATTDGNYDRAWHLRQKIPGMLASVSHPATENSCISKHHRTVWEMVMHLNDHHHWTREAIADWIDTLDVDLTVHDDPVGVRGTRTGPHGGDLGSCICDGCIADASPSKPVIAAGHKAAMQKHVDEGFAKISTSVQEFTDEMVKVEASAMAVESMVKNLQALMDKDLVFADDLKKQLFGNWPENNNKEEA